MTSMEGEHEYGFWHVLVRDVCYGQIPRAARAARHVAAAGWIEEKARERVEDLADVLAYHYQAALELNQAAGVGEQTVQLQAQVVRYLALAGERALSLDIEQAERQLAHALDLCPDDAPERASLLERWGQAAQQQGRLQEARQAFEHALDLYRAQVDGVAAGRVLTRLGNVVHRLGDPRCEEMLAEAVELLEMQPAGPELVAAYSYASGRRMFTDNYPEAIAGADRARTLAAEIGLPEPALALHLRGVCRCYLGEADGVEDLRRALGLALEQGLGRETAVIHGNLAGMIWLYQGPQAGLDEAREVLAFCERRGIAEMVLQISSGTPSVLAELGQTEQALAEAGPLADRIEAAGDMSWLEPRALQLRLLAETGSPQHAPDPEPLLIAAREIGLPDLIAFAFAAAARLLLAQGHPEQAQALAIELHETSAVRSAQAAWVLPGLLRTTLALGDTELAQHIFEGVEPRTPWAEHAVASARAQLAEADQRHADAAQLYREASERWRQFGNLPERAYALLGQGRCLAALSKPDAEAPLREARELFASMGYRPALAETEALLGESEAAAV